MNLFYLIFFNISNHVTKFNIKIYPWNKYFIQFDDSMLNNFAMLTLRTFKKITTTYIPYYF